MSTLKERKQNNMRSQQLKQILFIGGIALLVILACLFLFFMFSSKKTVSTAGNVTKDKSAKSEKPPEKDTSTESKKQDSRYAGINNVTLTISSAGDCTLGTDENFAKDTSLNAYYASQGSAYFFKNVKSIFESDDLTIVNMEGTLTKETARVNKKFAFKGDPSYVDILTNGSVEAANLANNHSHDYGDKSFEDTKQALKDADITSFGYDDVAVIDVKGIKVGLIGIYELKDHLDRKVQLANNIQKVKKEGAQLIIVNFHWGIERQTKPTINQVGLAHIAIDHGADLVIGHHPHILQGIEKYKDKYIAYSLGNFCFGGNKNPEDKDTMIFQQTFTITKDGVKTDDNTNIIPCSISSSKNKNNYQPTPATGAEAERIQKKIEDLSKDL